VRSSKPWLYSLARTFDATAGPLFRRELRPLPDSPRRILVSNIGHLGDALLTLGVPGALHCAFPGAEVDVLVSSAGATLFAGHRDVTHVHVHDAWLLARSESVLASAAGAAHIEGTALANGHAGAHGNNSNGLNGNGRQRIQSPGEDLTGTLRAREYDLALELRSYVPNSIPLLARSGAKFLCGFGSAGFAFLLDRVVPHIDGEHELHRFGRVVAELSGRATIEAPAPDLRHLLPDGDDAGRRPASYTILHPGTRRRRKRWDTKQWRKLAASLESAGTDVVVTGAAAEREWLESTFRPTAVRIMAGALDIPGLARLYADCDTFIGVDSFPSHLAALAGAPRVVILWHDHADPAEWAPRGSGTVNLLPKPATSDDVLRLIAEQG